jgi:hypothetical protein
VIDLLVPHHDVPRGAVGADQKLSLPSRAPGRPGGSDDGEDSARRLNRGPSFPYAKPGAIARETHATAATPRQT